MKAIILAAGVGSRIRPLTNNKPKSLLRVGTKTILGSMINNIQQVGIKDVIVVTGYLEDQIKNFAKNNFKNLNFQFITNEKYSQTNTGYSLMMTKHLINGDSFVKFDADVVFEKAILSRLIKSTGKTCLCIDRNIHLEAEEVKVITDGHGKVLKVGKKLNPYKAHGESIGIEKISPNAGKILFNILEKLMENPKNHNQYYDDSYTTLVKRGIAFHAVDITGLKWVEIDTHNDFKLAQKLFKG